MSLGFTAVGPRLEPDPTRVIAKLFAPGEETAESASRVRLVADRVGALTDDHVMAELNMLLEAFSSRHRNISNQWRRHAAIATDWLPPAPAFSEERTLLLGAYMTHEYSVEAAAFCNPSMVEHPDQTDVPEGSARFIMSARAIGEGHISSVEFRTGIAGPGELILDDRGRFLNIGMVSSGTHIKSFFAAHLIALDVDEETMRQVLRHLPPQFDDATLAEMVANLGPRLRGRKTIQQAVGHMERMAANQYELFFPDDIRIREQVLWPASPAERQGIEDVRLVRFTDDDGRQTYLGTYTAYDGRSIAPHLLATDDFRRYRFSQMIGSAATNKGMALFPRRVGGKHLALSRWDRENISLAISDDGHQWERGPVVHQVIESWEFIQTGNCGSPIETDVGWLVLTHGVGPMRMYSIGAMLLDLEDPTRVIAESSQPILVPQKDERDGYVPNVVYSCGAMLHGGLLTVPYGMNDTSIGFVQMSLEDLLNDLRAG